MDSQPSNKKEEKQINVKLLPIILIIGIYCVYLSWSCNSNCYPMMGQFEKIIRAIGAFFGNIGYLITYFIYWRPQCAWGPCPK